MFWVLQYEEAISFKLKYNHIMEYRRLGNTDVEVSRITMGAWAIGGWMWGGTDLKKAEEAIYESLENGVTTIDTAPIYGFGLSEEIVGKALKGKRDQAQIFTKCGMRWDIDKGVFVFTSKDHDGRPVDIYKYAGKDSIIEECERSLKRLQTDYIDLFQIHWPDATTPVDASMQALEQLKQEGKIRAGGVCNYSAEQMREAEKTAELASNQVPYSMVKRGIEEDVVPYCLEHGKSILAYSPMERGLLTGKLSEETRFREDDHRKTYPFFKKENIRKVNAFLNSIKPIADDRNITIPQLVLNWTLQQPGITVALAGARDAAQARQNAHAGDFNLTEEEVYKINQHLGNVELDLKKEQQV